MDNIPKDGWVYDRCVDLKELSGHCELCNARIRFQHIVKHPDCGELSIGCCCSTRVLNGEDIDYVIAQDKKMKSEARKYANKLQRSQTLYEAYLERVQRWNKTHPESQVIPKTRKEIYGV